MPVVFRNPVAAAMEIATLGRLYPGRFIAGLGHGVPGWMEQIGALPAKPMRALEETTSSIRRLLAGERFSLEGEHVSLRDVGLEHLPRIPPPVVLGVRRPVGLRISGRSADGTILGEPSAPAYIHWARERIEEGRHAGGRTDPHEVTVFVQGRIDADRSLARAVVANWVTRRQRRRPARRARPRRGVRAPAIARRRCGGRRGDSRRSRRRAHRRGHAGAGCIVAPPGRRDRRRRDRVRARRSRPGRATPPLRERSGPVAAHTVNGVARSRPSGGLVIARRPRRAPLTRCTTREAAGVDPRAGHAVAECVPPSRALSLP